MRASSTMVGIQAMTRSISQFLNRHSQSLSPARRGLVMLPPPSHTEAAPLQITQKSLWKQTLQWEEHIRFYCNWHLLYSLQEDPSLIWECLGMGTYPPSDILFGGHGGSQEDGAGHYTKILKSVFCTFCQTYVCFWLLGLNKWCSLLGMCICACCYL